jgi:hypothetical protein
MSDLFTLASYLKKFFVTIFREGDFHMFDSGIWYNDLMFTDDTVRLIRVPDNEKDIPQFVYYLGNDFIAQVKKLQKFTCVAVGSGSAPRTSLIPVYLISIISIIRLFL